MELNLNDGDLSRALEETWRMKNFGVQRKLSKGCDPWTNRDQNQMTNSSVRLSKLFHESNDSGLNGPLTVDASSETSSSLISLEPRNDRTDSELECDPFSRLTFDLEEGLKDSYEIDFDEVFREGRDRGNSDLTDNASLDWDYSDAMAMKAELDLDEESVFVQAPVATSSRLPSTSTRCSTRLESTGQYTEVSSMHSEDSQPGVLWRKRRVVLLIVDNRKYSDIAVDYYLDHIHREPYIVILVYCAAIPKIPICEEIPPLEYRSMITESKEEAELTVEGHKFRFQNAGIVHGSRIIHSDHPGSQILKVAETTEAEKVIIGKEEGKKRFSYFGKIVDYLEKHSELEVMICPPEPEKLFDCCGFPVAPSQPSKKKKKKRHLDKASDSVSLISSV